MLAWHSLARALQATGRPGFGSIFLVSTERGDLGPPGGCRARYIHFVPRWLHGVEVRLHRASARIACC